MNSVIGSTFLTSNVLSCLLVCFFHPANKLVCVHSIAAPLSLVTTDNLRIVHITIHTISVGIYALITLRL